MKNCEVLKPFATHYEVTASEADFSNDTVIEKDGLLIKTRKHYKRVLGKVESLRTSFEDTYKKDDLGNYRSKIPGMKIIVRDSVPYDVMEAGTDVLSLPDDCADMLESKGLVRIVK